MAKKMKLSNKKLFLGIGIGLVAALGGIAVWRLFLKNAIVYGTIVDTETDEPLHGAMVTLSGGDDFYETVRSDINGKFQFTENIKTSYIAAGYPYFYYYTLEIKMADYESYSEHNILFHPAVNNLLIKLESL